MGIYLLFCLGLIPFGVFSFMLKIRLQRVGRKHEPAFRVVLTDSRNSTKSGRYLEVLGSHDLRGGRGGALNKERILYLISKGAKPTGTVHNLLIKKGVITGAKIDVSAKKKSKTDTEVKNEVKGAGDGEEKEEVKKEDAVLEEVKK